MSKRKIGWYWTPRRLNQLIECLEKISAVHPETKAKGFVGCVGLSRAVLPGYAKHDDSCSIILIGRGITFLVSMGVIEQGRSGARSRSSFRGFFPRKITADEVNAIRSPLAKPTTDEA